KRKLAATVMSVMLAVVATTLWVAPIAAADAPRIIPLGSDAYGKTYPEWLGIYFRWSFGTVQDPTQSSVGHVQLMPQPPEEYVSGSGTPEDPAVFAGQLAITLRPGTPFVLPLAGLYGERYAGYPAVPDDDPALVADLLDTLSAKLTIDGKTLISDA